MAIPKLTIDILSEDRLRKAATPEAFQRGLELFEQDNVLVTKIGDQVALCTVTDKRPVPVEIKLTTSHLYLRCDCLHGSRGLVCEHEVAACLATRQRLRQQEPPAWRARLGKLMDAMQSGTRSSSSAPYLLYFSLQKSTGYDWRILPYVVALNMLPAEIRTAILANEIPDLDDFIQKNQELTTRLRTPYNTIEPLGCLNASLESAILANVLIDQTRSFYQVLSFDNCLHLIDASGAALFLGTTDHPLHKRLSILNTGSQLGLEIERDDKGITLRPKVIISGQANTLQTDEFQTINHSPLWLLADTYLFQLESKIHPGLFSSLWESQQLHIPAQGEGEFLERYYLELAQQMPLTGSAVSWQDIQTAPIPRLYLSDTKDELLIQLRFAYGEIEVHYDADLPSNSVQRAPGTWTLVRVTRQPEIEAEAYRLLGTAAYGLKRSGTPSPAGQFRLRARTHPVDFLLHKLPRLAHEGFEIYGEENLKSARVNRNTPTIAFNVSSGIDWFDVKTVINFGELEVALKDVLRVMRKKERFIKLADGTIGEIPENWFERYRHLFTLGENTQEGLRVSRHHVALLEDALSEANQSQVDTAFEEHRQRLQSLRAANFDGVAQKELPPGFQGELRPYQKAGYEWLHFLNEFKFGGCLADDMGLGKTVQALVFLQSIYQQRDQPGAPQHASLLVVPRSLLVNWQREAERFTPGLKVMEYFDTDRTKDPNVFDEADLVITTYGVMLRDIQWLHSYTFYYAILDESQVIKNPLSQTARAARLIQSQHRLVLTGTPIENSTVELWSQFSFLNPGLLGNLEYFKKEFGTPIERHGDQDAASLLRKLVYPFILRRTKDQVAPELPPRTERILYTDMEPAQRKLYTRTRDYYRGMLLGMIETEGMNNARMKILEGLLRLRQISNHPALVDDKFRGDSGKMELLMETLETLQSEGHKALVFSQFVQMLSLVRHELDQRQIPYAYLDGQTQDRQARVDRFQSDQNLPFFLISLKAGGLGLNLTAADYVIHIDPWWNPAVEMQASDRTHRIGQDKPVFVFKLIVRDSVEEKILLLQDQKKRLVDQIITTESAFFKNLTAQDIEVLFS